MTLPELKDLPPAELRAKLDEIEDETLQLLRGRSPVYESILATRELVALARKLLDFKTYVHQRLDDGGIPADPESPHKAKGCRIGGRLDAVLAERDAAVAERDALAAKLESLGKAMIRPTEVEL